jgi:hypothetical protein
MPPDDDHWSEEAPDAPLPEDNAPSELPARPWRRAVAAGCRAAAWWLELHTGPWSPVVAVGVGLVAGAAALVSGSPLLDVVHGGAALLGGTPAW